MSTACPHGQRRTPDPSSTCVTCRGEWFAWKYSTVYGHERGMEWCRQEGHAAAARWFAEKARCPSSSTQ